MAKTKSKTPKSDAWFGKSDPAWDDGSAFPEISPKNGNEVVVDAGISLKNGNEIILDAEISQIQENGQITLFYDSLGEPPEPDDFTSTEAYNQAYQDWQQKHPDLSNHGFTSNPEKPEIGTLCTIITGHKKYIGESGYVCAYHQDDSPEFWVKLDHHDLQLRCSSTQISISLKNHRGFAIGDSVVDLKNEGRTGTIKILRSSWLIASWDNQNEGIYYYEHILKIGSCIYSKTEQRSGVVVSIGRSGFSVEWQGWLKCAYSFAQIEELQLSKIEEIEPCDSSMSVQALGLDSALPAYKQEAELKNLGLIARGEVLNPVILSDWYNLPQNWLDPSESSPAIQLLENRDRQQEIFSILESQRSPLPESNTLPQSPTLTPTIATTTTSKKQLYKAVTVRQPHASLFGFHKGFETRDKATNYRGVILIHAAIEHDDTRYLYSTLADLLPPYEELVFGSIVAIADLTDCIKMTEEFIAQQSETELRCGLWEVGRYAWKLENVVILNEPIPARGMPGLWEFELPITKPEFKTGEYILNGRVGEIIEDSPGEYFSVQYSQKDLKCYFFGQDDELISQLALVKPAQGIAPQKLVDQFLRENLVTELCRSAEPSIKPEISPKKKKVASGSLAPYLENKKLKDGTIVTYPRVQGERDKFNHLHWNWGYYYEIKVNGEWKNRSLPTPARIVPQVKIMIENHCPVDEIKDFILQCKNKKGGVVNSEN